MEKLVIVSKTRPGVDSVSDHELLITKFRLKLKNIGKTTRPLSKMKATGEVKGKPLRYSCFGNPMDSMKRQKDRMLKDELPQSIGA